MGQSLVLEELSPALDWQSPTRVRAWSSSSIELPADGTHYVLAYRGGSTIQHLQRLQHLEHLPRASFPFDAGMFASVPGSFVIDGAANGGSGLVITHQGYRGVFQLGGPIEQHGRLRYIDGCTDSLLLGPPVLGDPCLNHLHIPAGTSQTTHFHPSVRVGIIIAGEGTCITPSGDHPLRAGLAFMIPKGLTHSFCTRGSSLDVVVYHPDSDTGPTDEDHPMRNRTLLRAT